MHYTKIDLRGGIIVHLQARTQELAPLVLHL